MSSSVHLHRLAEERSLALHRVVADRIRSDPNLVAAATERVEGWLATGDVAEDYAKAWRAVLSMPIDEVCRFLVDEGERARALRQATPFSGVVDPRLRWTIWRDVRRRMEGA